MLTAPRTFGDRDFVNMAIKNILCAYSGHAGRGASLRHAIHMAKHHDGWLTGVLRHGRPRLEKSYHGQLPVPVLEQLRRSDSELIDRVRAQFTGMVRAQGLEHRADFIDLVPDRDGPMSSFARSFDIVVTGTHATDLADEHASAFPDLIALRSGRPVLVVPPTFESEGLADHALLAWDGKRASARALGDAMPILEEKSQVTVLSVGTAPPTNADFLIRNLERQGISVRFETRARKGSVSDTILSTAREVSARLLVMGAFEHSKFSHDIMGGVTTDVMRDTHIPVLLSH
jgi:nucleotide-binding universal stress UspA family protein